MSFLTKIATHLDNHSQIKLRAADAQKVAARLIRLAIDKPSRGRVREHLEAIDEALGKYRDGTVNYATASRSIATRRRLIVVALAGADNRKAAKDAADLTELATGILGVIKAVALGLL